MMYKRSRYFDVPNVKSVEEQGSLSLTLTKQSSSSILTLETLEL